MGERIITSPIMVTLSKDDRDVIAKHPLGSSLDSLHDLLQRTERLYEQESVSHDKAVDDPAEPRESVTGLLLALMGHKAAYNLRSRVADSDVASELATIFRRVLAGNLHYPHFRALLQLIIKKASDIDIWKSVFNLIDSVSRITPPASIPPSFDSTPIKPSSASLQGTEQTRKLIEARVFEELRSCTFRNVGGFFDKYFDGKAWTKRTKQIYQSIKHQHVNGRWTDFPDPPAQEPVVEWLMKFQSKHLTDASGEYCTTKSSKELTSAEARRQLDLLVKYKGTFQERHDWKDFLVVGELKQSKGDFKSTLSQLGRYVRDVFTVQPTRRYVHAFTLQEYTMELWVFDRSGAYSSGPFNIHEEPERFIRAIAGYVMMSHDELGLDNFIVQEGQEQIITLESEATKRQDKLHLELKPIVRQRAVVCRGTCCYSTIDKKHVVKFSWTSDKRPSEAKFLRLAKERGVKGIAELLGHYRITSIAEMREGLTFSEPHSFRSLPPSATSSFSQSQTQLAAVRSFSKLRSLSIAGAKRALEDAEENPSKRSRLSSQKSKLKYSTEATASSQEGQASSLFAPNNDLFSNRLFSCLAISPAGRTVSEYRSIPELLRALRDAITAHMSLYTDGAILHRDVSENNIIITDPKKANGFYGMLIDLDLAKEVGSGRSGARHQTGTMEFMAIEVLLGIAHTYRHDLESFFYVLIWLCARHGWRFSDNVKGQPTDSLLSQWYTGTFKDIARIKLGDMDKGKRRGLDIIMEEFPPAFDTVKPLCKDLRDILFPYKDGLFIGTPEDPQSLYRPILKAFDDALREL